MRRMRRFSVTLLLAHQCSSDRRALTIRASTGLDSITDSLLRANASTMLSPPYSCPHACPDCVLRDGSRKGLRDGNCFRDKVLQRSAGIGEVGRRYGQRLADHALGGHEIGRAID